MPKKLNAAFSVSFSANIWNMLADHDAHYLYLELRNEEAHQVSFAAYHIAEKRMLWQGLSFDESWWIGMTAADRDVLVFHTYEDTENPEKKAYFAIRTDTRQLIWESKSLQVSGIKNNRIYGYEQNEEDKAYKYFALDNGSEKSLSNADASAALQSIAVENIYIRHPFRYSEEDAYFETVRKFLLEYLNQKPLKGCEYLEHQQLIFISYYIKEASALANYLLVVDQEGALQLHEKLDDQLSQQGLGTFMIIRDQLIFIKGKRELVSYAM